MHQGDGGGGRPAAAAAANRTSRDGVGRDRVTVATITWTTLRYDVPVFRRETLLLVAGVAVMYLVSMPERDERRGSPSGPAPSSPSS
jgi:hypothetical protein